MRLGLLALFVAACNQSAPMMMTTVENNPGKTTHTLTVDGMDREMIVYVPEKARMAAAPVVIMFHGTSGDGEKFFNISGWKEKADAEGLIAVFPTALVTCYHEDENHDGDFDDADERDVTTKWMAWDWATTKKFEQCTAAEIAALPADKRAAADHPLQDDVAFFDAMLELLADQYQIDQKRVYVSGFSNGGCMTARLAMERSEAIAAAASNAGFLQMPVTPQARPLWYAMTLGAADDRFTGSLGVSSIPVEESLFTQLPVLSLVMNQSLTMVQLTDPYVYSETMTGGRKTGGFTYSTSTAGGNNQLVFRVIEGLTHAYPNGKNHPVVMADVLWEMFRTQSLP
jgi:polyhydroxybutyrate depolymerase